MSSQPEVAKLAPELVEGVTSLARTLVSAARHWTLYPEQHPAVRAAFDRLAHTIQEVTNDEVFSIGITPDSLMIESFPVPSNPQIVEAARLLHDRDLIRLTFSGKVPSEAISKLLHMLALDRETLRKHGGPQGLWRVDGHTSITLEQIDFAQVLEDKEQHSERTHDDLWKSIVHSIVSGQKTMDEMAQQRLLAIAGDPFQISDLAMAVMAPKCTADGAPMITTQAATVLAAFRHLASLASVKADQSDAVMRNLATAAASLDPHVVLEILQSDDSPGDAVQIVQGLSGAFDDMKVAQLLATALSNDGQATGRLAEVFDTIAPDPERKKRVLTMTRTLLSESSFGQTKQFKAIWSSMEELLIAYNDEPFVSKQYRSQLDGATARGEAIALKDLPEEMPEWAESLGQQNVRKLSVVLIIDLLRLERQAERAAEIADDMTGLAEDLLMAGDYSDARNVAKALADTAIDTKFVAPGACREALARLATSAAMHEAVAMIDDFDDESLGIFADICRLVGVPVVDVLGMTLRLQDRTAARVRASDIIVGFGAPAVSRLAMYIDEERGFVQCNVAELLGRIGAPDAVPLLQPLLRRSDTRVVRAAVTAMASINDPAAARAIHTVLRAVTGEQRRAVIDALVAERDTRVVPMLIRILDESEPLGKDHSVVLDTLAALKVVHTDSAVRPIARVAGRTRWFAFSKNRALKQTAVETLASIGTEESRKALAKAAQEGDRVLRSLAKNKLDSVEGIMSDIVMREDFVRRLSAAIRAGELYASTHPLVQRSIDTLLAVTTRNLQNSRNTVVGFLGNDIVVNDLRLGKFSAQLVGFVRDMHEREIEKISFDQGVTRDEVRTLIEQFADRRSPVPLPERLTARGVRRITIGKISVEADDGQHKGIAMAKKVYNTAVETAENLWDQAKAGDKPDPNAARKIIESLAKVVTQDRTSLMALTALKKYDNYTFTHMVNVSVLAMSQARALNLEGPLLREFGFAALMHDIGKVNTPLEVLNKPGKLDKDEFDVMKRHVIDGAHILRKTPEMPALAPIVAFEHHLKQDLSGYPENIGHRDLNLCTMIVSIADVFDALRSNRPYREGLATDRIRSIMGEQGNPAFNQKLLKRFVNIMGLFPVGNLVRLNTDEVGVITAEHPADPFRPQVKIVFNDKGERLEEPFLANTWERDDRGEYSRAVVEAIDPDSIDIDPLTLL